MGIKKGLTYEDIYGPGLAEQKRLLRGKGKTYEEIHGKENNIVYEVDEDYHKNNYLNDIRREEKIKEITNCKIVRLNEKSCLQQIYNKKLFS